MNIIALVKSLQDGTLKAEQPKRLAGLYVIVNLDSGLVYVGSSLDVRQRFYQHRTHLNVGQHSNERLQKDWDTTARIVFVPVQYVEDYQERKNLERLAIRQVGGVCYNYSEGGPKRRPREVTNGSSQRSQALRAKRRGSGLMEIRGLWADPAHHTHLKLHTQQEIDALQSNSQINT